jgi:hypothetical protein
MFLPSFQAKRFHGIKGTPTSYCLGDENFLKMNRRRLAQRKGVA